MAKRKSRIQIGKTVTVKGKKYKISAGTAKGKKYKATASDGKIIQFGAKGFKAGAQRRTTSHGCCGTAKGRNLKSDN
jgi:hypothetical protein